MSYIKDLSEKGLIHPPKWLSNNVVYEVLMGSVAYGVSSDTSDMDVYGICIPLKEEIFPHLRGEILGFGRQKQRFEQFQQHHINSPDDLGGKGRVYDITCYNIVKFFTLAMENNPNIIDSLFVPFNCVLYTNQIGQLIRENRRLFLHKGSFHKFKGYSYSQLHKIRTNKSDTSSRKELIDKYGYDIKFAYHVIRLLDEIDQILTLGDLDLQRAAEQMKSVRRGEWTEQQIYDYFNLREKQLEEAYHSSKLPYGPDESAIKRLLLQCLEICYGNLDGCIKVGVNISSLLDDIDNIVDTIRKNI